MTISSQTFIGVNLLKYFLQIGMIWSGGSLERSNEWLENKGLFSACKQTNNLICVYTEMKYLCSNILLLDLIMSSKKQQQ